MGGVYSEFQMAEDFANHCALRDDGDEPQGPALTPRAVHHLQRKDPLQQPRPVPLETGKTGIVLVASWTAILTTCAWRAPTGRARRALRFERLSWTGTPAGPPWLPLVESCAMSA